MAIRSQKTYPKKGAALGIFIFCGSCVAYWWLFLARSKYTFGAIGSTLSPRTPQHICSYVFSILMIQLDSVYLLQIKDMLIRYLDLAGRHLTMKEKAERVKCKRD